MNKMLGEFNIYRQEVDSSVKLALKKIKTGQKNIKAGNYLWEKLKNEIKQLCQKATGFKIEKIELCSPPPHISGDFSIEVFSLAKTLGQNPGDIAQKIADYINGHCAKTKFVQRAAVVGAFVNIEIKKQNFYQNAIAEIKKIGERYGESDINLKKIAVIDFSAPNIAKPIGVGHLRSTIIGNALSNIYNCTGYYVIKDNHLGDWGTQFGKLIYAWQKWGKEDLLENNAIVALKDLYVKFNDYAKNNPEAQDDARRLFAKLEAKTPELIGLWKRFRDLSTKNFQEIYSQLGINFDTAIGESYFSDQADEIVKQCLEKKLCKKDPESEAIVAADIQNIPSFLLKKQDGSSLYITRDLAALKFRIKTFKPDDILYVVGSEQELNFRQMFALAKKMGYLTKKTSAKHIGFGMVMVGGKKMSTREGTAVSLQDLITQAIEKSKEILAQKNPQMIGADIETVSKIVGIGAIVYNDLSQSRIKNITFDWKKMLDFEGGSAAYLQYSYVRIKSILKKAAEVEDKKELREMKEKDFFFESKIELNLAKKLAAFCDVIVKAQQADFPHYICVYLEELALLFNSFYAEISIINTRDEKLRQSRVILAQSVALVIKKGLSLLGIAVPEKM